MPPNADKMAAERKTGDADEVIPKTAAAVQKSEHEKILERLNWVHKRVSLLLNLESLNPCRNQHEEEPLMAE